MKYLLTFKPLKHFFFGNSKTFSDDYLAVSEYFPQNTQLLGALRLFIAEQHKLMKVYKKGKWCDRPEELKSLTGSTTSRDFMINDNLGKIKNLSQMFIVSKDLNDAYFPTPLDIKISDDIIEYYNLTKIDNDYYLKNYDAKNHLSRHLGGRAFWNRYINNQILSKDDLKPFDTKKGFFIEHFQAGIELENKQTVDERFYSKKDYQLNENFLFASIIDLEEKIIDDGLIQIGAEGSMFELKIQKLDETDIKDHPIVLNLFDTPSKADKIVMLSDAIFNHTDDLNAKFSIIPYYKDFAMIESESNSFQGKSKEKNYTKFKGKTKQKRVIPAGAVIYPKDNSSLSQNIGAFAKMGYNQFISVKNQEK